ncbi:MAG TPA: metallophosphoesterase [Gemmatimonadaceae bacterium]|nr:metallophosphoesterase [Gemmatimonadaceae bacterium]
MDSLSAHRIRILFLADTHLGFDLPTRARIQRRRRGHDFLANYATALAPALAGEADIVVHGGDVFNRSKVPTSVAWQAFEPLARVADRGIPVFVVPGNHERGRIPQIRFAQHPRIHLFERPRTFTVDVRGMRLAVAGFPSERDDVRTQFIDLLAATRWRSADADARILCIHQCVEGATVGPNDFTFTTAADVIRARELPAGLCAVLSGHIHRHQVLTHDLRGAPIAAPVLYPGSIERTSVAEADETKGYMTVDLTRDAGETRVDWQFHELPARPLLRREIHLDAVQDCAVEAVIRNLIAESPADAVLTIRVAGRLGGVARRTLAAANLRRLAPATMNVELKLEDEDGVFVRPASSRQSDVVLELPLG